MGPPQMAWNKQGFAWGQKKNLLIGYSSVAGNIFGNVTWIKSGDHIDEQAKPEISWWSAFWFFVAGIFYTSWKAWMFY